MKKLILLLMLSVTLSLGASAAVNTESISKTKFQCSNGGSSEISMPMTYDGVCLDLSVTIIYCPDGSVNVFDVVGFWVDCDTDETLDIAIDFTVSTPCE